MAPLTIASRRYNIMLLLIVVTTLPITTLLLWLNYAAVALADQKNRFSLRTPKATSRKTILITGTRSAYGLNLARAFHKDGHRVVGADLAGQGFFNISKRSRAITKHYELPPLSAIQDSEYIARCILIVVKKEYVDLWIDCSQDLPLSTITTARTELQERSSCVCLAADSANIRHLRDREAFLNFLRGQRLPAPEVHQVRSRSDIHNVLNRSQGKKHFMLTSPEKAKPSDQQALLPRRTLSQTYHDVSLVKINEDSPMLLEEYVNPALTYECFAVVVQGTVRFFWATQTPISDNAYFNDDSALWRAMRAYTDAIARVLGHNFSSHLTLLFGVIERVSQIGVESKLLPLRGSYHLNHSFVLPASKSSDLVQAYTHISKQILNGTSTSATHDLTTTTPSTTKKQFSTQRYFLLEDITNLFLDPCIGLLQRRTSLSQVLTNIVTLLHRFLFWDEAYYDFWDPVPAFWQYSVLLAWTTLFASSQGRLRSK